jgi:hypothetical protein
MTIEEKVMLIAQLELEILSNNNYINPELVDQVKAIAKGVL